MQKREYELMYRLEESHWWFLAKRKFIESVLGGKRFQRIIDVGCGTGGTTNFLRKYGDVVGIEKNDEAIKFAKRRGVKIIKGSAKKIPLKSGSAELVCFFDVLYHRAVKSDQTALKEANRILKTSGTLVITDSALPFLMGPHDVATHARERYYLDDLVGKVKRAGFRIRRKSYIYFFLFPLIFISRTVSKFKKEKIKSDLSEMPPLLNFLALLVCKIEAFFLREVSFPYGSSLIILAQKR